MGFAFARGARLIGSASGCAGIATGNTEMPLTGLDPSYREVVAARLRSVLKNYDSYDSFEISDPRLVHSIKGPAWLFCVTHEPTGRLSTVAAIFGKRSPRLNPLRE